MALFGWVCSPLCRNKAEANGIDVPEYEGLQSAVIRRQWRKTARNAIGIAAVLLFILGIWVWYEWIGSVPRTWFAFSFPQAASGGELRAATRDQIILIHGDTLYRHDIKARRVVWSVPIIEKDSLARQAADASASMERAREAAVQGGADRDDLRLPSMEEIQAQVLRAFLRATTLYVHGENIWVEAGGTLTRYDWDTGKPGKIIVLGPNVQKLSQRGSECFVLIEDNSGDELHRIDLVTGESKLEKIPHIAKTTTSNSAPALVARGGPGGKLPPGAAQLDPAKLAREIQNLPLPNRLALPATLAAAANQERLRAELNGMDPDAPGQLPGAPGDLTWSGDGRRVLPTATGYVEFSSRLGERRIVNRKVMKDPPGKSALDGPVNQAATAAIANELLNDIARERLGDSVEEDESRYLVTIHRPGAADWTGDVIGRPGFIPLDTVNLVTGPKSIVVLDKANKKLWEAKLTYELSGGDDLDDDDQKLWGAGPAVERGDTLYLFDGGVLTAFELRTGNARWRLPSVGIAGLFFDDKGMLYLNTTTASHDTVRYSRQIDISQKTRSTVVKLDPSTGKTLWHADNDGMVRYLSGKFLYTVESSAGETPSLMNLKFGPAPHPHIRITRLNLSNGRAEWEHHQGRAPLDVQFEKNEIRILFRNELQVLRFVSL